MEKLHVKHLWHNKRLSRTCVEAKPITATKTKARITIIQAVHVSLLISDRGRKRERGRMCAYEDFYQYKLLVEKKKTIFPAKQQIKLFSLSFLANFCCLPFSVFGMLRCMYVPQITHLCLKLMTKWSAATHSIYNNVVVKHLRHSSHTNPLMVWLKPKFKSCCKARRTHLCFVFPLQGLELNIKNRWSH